MGKKNRKYDDAGINQAIKLLEENGFEVERTWFNREHRLRGPVSDKEVRKACEWLKDNPSGCVHYDMFRFNGMVYSIVFGVLDYGDNDQGIYREIARQPADSALQCSFDTDWDMPMRLDKDGNETYDVWNNMDRVCGLDGKQEDGIPPVWCDAAKNANQWALLVYVRVLEGECR